MARRFKIAFCIVVLAGLLAVGLSTTVKMLHDGHLKSFLSGPEKAEAALSDNLLGDKFLLIPYRVTNALLGTRYFVGSELYIEDNGQVVKQTYTEPSSSKADNVAELAAFCEERGIDFIYIIAPGKPEYDSELLDIGIPCHRNETADILARGLEERGINLYDLRERFHDGYDDWFYKTDHHWNTEAGLEATRLIVERLNADFGCGLDASRLDDELFERTVYPHCFVGENGLATLGPFGTIEDFTVIKPKYDVDLHYVSPDIGVDRTGGFDIMLEDFRLEDRSFLGARTRYYYYLDGNHNKIELTNNDVEKGDILLVKDSFSTVVTPFLAMASHHVTAWDMREDPHIFEYIEEHPEIETVVVLYNTGSTGTTNLNDFQ